MLLLYYRAPNFPSTTIGASEKHQTTIFHEGETTWSASARPSSDPTRTTTIQESDSLSEFFSRPIQVAAYAWVPGTNFALAKFDPWTLFFTNKRVANRLSNYALINCTLKVKFQINGNGFYYGRLMADWHPYHNSDLMTSSADNFYAAIGASQRIKVFIDPTNSQGAEMHIPFVYTRNSMSVVDAEWDVLGQVILRQLVDLKHANSSLVPLTISAYVWAEDVVVSLPTTVNAYGLTAQASEADESVTTKVTSTVAATAGALSTVPGIGPYAMATSMVATKLGNVARLFGFSRPAILREPEPMRPRYMGSLATTDTADTVDKLTVTSKAELSIDPRIVGVDTGDELVISDIAARESLYDVFSWTNLQATGTLLRNFRVTPVDARVESSTTYHFPACAFAARPFRYWRGVMRYRIVIVASAFHKGRLRFVWDPVYLAGTGATELNLAYTRVVDLENERDFVIDIPWGQPDPFCTVPRQMGTAADLVSSTRYTTSSSDANGVFGVFVQNSLTAANDSPTSVSILVFKSCQDMCVAVPDEEGFSGIINAYSATPQAKEIDEASMNPEACEPVSTAPPDEMGDGECNEDQLKVFFGEAITSFRSLLKRYMLHSVFFDATSTALALWAVNNTDFPCYKGYSSTALHRTSTGKKINYTQQTLLNYLAPAFLACRGSLRTKYHLTSTTAPAAMNGMTLWRFVNTNDQGETHRPLTLTTDSTYSRDGVLYRTGLFNGGTYTAPECQPVLEAELPYYKACRFDLTKDVNLSTGNTARGGFGLGHMAHQVTCQVSGAGTRQLTRFISAGEDFTLVFFQGCPPMVAFPNGTLPAAAIT